MPSLSHQCPQCGAPVELEETDRTFFCPFCRVSLFVCSDVVTHYFPVASPVRGSRFFVPYWRLRGTEFRASPQGMTGGVIDVTECACSHPAFPRTLGIRAQALEMRFLVPETQGKFLDVEVSRADVVRKLCKRAHAFPDVATARGDVACRDGKTALLAKMIGSSDPSDRRVAAACQDALSRNQPAREIASVADTATVLSAFIGETVSLIYTPFVLDGSVLRDGITGEDLGRMSGDTASVGVLPDRPHLGVRFVATLCPNCAWELKGAADALVHVCAKCGSAWSIGSSGLSPVGVGVWPGGSTRPDLWLPFWRIKVDVKGLALTSHADFIRLTNAPRVVSPDMEMQRHCFWVPAFKANPSVFLRLASTMTLEQPTGVLDEKEAIYGILSRRQGLSDDKLFYPANLPLSEAIESLAFIIFASASAKKRLQPLLSSAEFTSGRGDLVAVPFEGLAGGEYGQPEAGVSVHGNALKWGRETPRTRPGPASRG